MRTSKIELLFGDGLCYVLLQSAGHVNCSAGWHLRQPGTFRPSHGPPATWGMVGLGGASVFSDLPVAHPIGCQGHSTPTPRRTTSPHFSLHYDILLCASQSKGALPVPCLRPAATRPRLAPSSKLAVQENTTDTTWNGNGQTRHLGLSHPY